MKSGFNEEQWTKMIFLLADTQTWLDDLCREGFSMLPVPGKKKFLRRHYYLSVPALAHILERHYHRINRHPHAGKFHIDLVELLHYIREAGQIPEQPVLNSNLFQRILLAPGIIGFDRDGNATPTLTVVTDAGGKIITAFPGVNVFQFQDVQPSVEKPATENVVSTKDFCPGSQAKTPSPSYTS